MLSVTGDRKFSKVTKERIILFRRSLLAVALLAVCSGVAATVHVAPTGDDANPGTSEKPVRTLEAARDAARRTGAKTVVLGDGIYRLERPLALDARDGGVAWRAARSGGAVISGSVKPRAYGRVEDAETLALLPENARGKVVYAEFPESVELPGFRGGGCGTPQRLCETPVSVFQGERRLLPARWPNEGFARVERLVGKVEGRHDAKFTSTGAFTFRSDRLARWAKEPDLWAYGLWCYEWADAKAQVLGVDLASSTIRVDPSPIGFGIKEGAQFYVMNALCELDRPGEWVLDRTRRRIYVWPFANGGALNFACAPGLVRADKAHGLVFDGIVFDCVRTDALKFENCSNCSVVASVVRRTSAWAVVVSGGVSNRVEGCDLYDLGEGGVRLSGGDRNTLAPSRHVADNNHIHHYGQVVPNYKPGVQLNGVGNRATHNLIHHAVHQALAFDGNDHYIGFNVCHDCCMFNDDAGTIYCCQRDWTKRGTVVEHNLVHMTGKQPRGTHTEGIYLDDFSSGVIVRGNIINRASLGVYVGGGQDCEVSGNLVFNCTKGLELGSRGIETFGKAVSGKGFGSEMFASLNRTLSGLHADLYRRRYPKMADVLGFADGQAAHNAHWNVMTNNVLVGCRGIGLSNWTKVAATCRVTNNLETTEDPGLADYFGLDWSFRPGSEVARRLGDLRFREMGLYASLRRASPAVRFGAGVTPPRPFGEEYDLATVRVDVPFLGKLPDGTAACATALQRCAVPDWSRGMRVVTGFGMASLEEWQDYRFAFTPAVSGAFEVVIMGMRGEKTLYDDFKAEGATLADGGFEHGKGWRVPTSVNTNDHRFSVCNTFRPWGVVTAAETGVPAAEGEKMWCGNDLIGATQRIQCCAGVSVKISFKARALPIGKKEQ